jgi:hypothetical protein
MIQNFKNHIARYSIISTIYDMMHDPLFGLGDETCMQVRCACMASRSSALTVAHSAKWTSYDIIELGNRCLYQFLHLGLMHFFSLAKQSLNLFSTVKIK